METNTANPNIKFKQLPDAEVLEQLNNMAIDAQWDFTNAKSPKGQRDAEVRLNLYGSAVEMIKRMKHADDLIGIFREGKEENNG